jgi:hypothetical protein
MPCVRKNKETYHCFTLLVGTELGTIFPEGNIYLKVNYLYKFDNYSNCYLTDIVIQIPKMFRGALFVMAKNQK